MNFRSSRGSLHELRHGIERQHAVHDRDPVLGHFELGGDEIAQGLGHHRIELDADDGAAAATLQRALEQADQILGLFLDLDVASRG